MIPNLLDINLPGFLLVDSRTIVDKDERGEALKFARHALDDLIEKTRQNTNRCAENYLVAHQASQEALIAINPDATNEELQVVQIGPSECDVRLQTIAMILYRGSQPRKLIGGFFLYNIRIVSESSSLIEITAYPAPGVPHNSDIQWSKDVRDITTRFLDADSDLPLEDGRFLDVLEWQHPVDGLRNWSGGEPWAELYVSDMEASGYPRENVGATNRLKKFTRKSRGNR